MLSERRGPFQKLICLRDARAVECKRVWNLSFENLSIRSQTKRILNTDERLDRFERFKSSSSMNACRVSRGRKKLICTPRSKMNGGDKEKALAEARAFAPLRTDGTEYAFSLMGIEERRVARIVPTSRER